jgi:hypothetical protein
MADEQLPAAAAAVLQAAGADATELQVQGDQKHGPGPAGRPAGPRSPSDDEQGDGDGKDPALHLQHHGRKQLLQHPHHRQLLLLVLVTCVYYIHMFQQSPYVIVMRSWNTCSLQ